MAADMDIVPAQDTPDFDVDPKTLPPLRLPEGVTSRFVDTNALNFHVLESVPKNVGTTRPPLILCIHGFPELAYSWRYILPRLAEQGYYAVAFDQRGYGRTHSPDLKSIPGHSFRPLSLIKDTISLVQALGYSYIHTIVGHDFGAVTATYMTLARGSAAPPDFVRSLVLMSHPFKGVPPILFNTSPNPNLPAPADQESSSDPYAKTRDPKVHDSLASIEDRPRKHYKWYYCTRPSASEMTYPAGGPLHTFYRGYFHLKSADWSGNHNPAPHPLASWTASELAKMPHYYIMPRDATMRQAVERDMADQPPSTFGTNWLPDEDLAVYVSEYTRTTFGPPMNWYRIQTSPEAASDSQLFVNRKISVPMKFVAGKQDWGTYQEPGAVEAMETGRSVEQGSYLGTVLVDGAGHWVNQEKWERCVEEIVDVARHVTSENGKGGGNQGQNTQAGKL
ncbi:hypothetical protein LTR05_000075 [Lithohypha guttulata]|uniref:AB hydrolase-1 domain-containing protein n=1 Tax=Lithohypha guttulata TaxID=1690604 RepID=A0AAN7T3X2_9EURO|nr:hypothetical protein LTR05_000075 [Lithohypha guttulata]